MRFPALLATLVALAACQATPAPSAPAPADARRIVSLAPSLTEIVFDLGVGDRIVGVTDFATYPPEVAKIERLGGLMNPNLERLTALEPDLVLTHSSNTRVVEHTSKLGIATLSLATDTIDEIFGCYEAIGKATGTTDRATARVAELRKALAPRAPQQGDKPRVLVVVGRNPGSLEGLTAAGPGTFIDELVVGAGAQNVAADTKRPWPQVSKEFLLVNPPDVIIELRPSSPIPDAELIAAWSTLDALPAVRERRVVQLDGDYLLLPGPRIVHTARDIRRAIEAGQPPP